MSGTAHATVDLPMTIVEANFDADLGEGLRLLLCTAGIAVTERTDAAYKARKALEAAIAECDARAASAQHLSAE